MRRGFKTWAEKKSVELRYELSLKYYDQLVGKDLAIYLGVELKNPNDIEGLSSIDKTILLKHNSAWSAITIKNKNDRYIIIYNPMHSDGRRESDLMHEIAHIICCHSMEKIQVREDFPFPLRGYDAMQEEEASWLGGCLQAPRKALIWAKNKNMNNDDIASHFGASAKMIAYRLNVTGVEKQLKRRFN